MEDRCVACGEVVAEGRHICVSCEKKFEKDKPKAEVKETNLEQMWQALPTMAEISPTLGRNAMESLLEKSKNKVCVYCLEEHPEVDRVNGEPFCFKCKTKGNSVTSVTQAVWEDTKKQQAKADSGKPILSYVPKEIIYEIEKVRSFGVKKYKDPDNWKKVDIERYHQALLRHTLAIWNDVQARDTESGLLHLSHIACNVAFILELLKEKE